MDKDMIISKHVCIDCQLMAMEGKEPPYKSHRTGKKQRTRSLATWLPSAHMQPAFKAKGISTGWGGLTRRNILE